MVRSGKGSKNRVTLIPRQIIDPLQEQLQIVRRIHQQDLDRGYGQVPLSFALAKKYPNADCDWVWQYVFPSQGLSRDPQSTIVRRHHLQELLGHKDLKTTMIYTHVLN